MTDRRHIEVKQASIETTTTLVFTWQLNSLVVFLVFFVLIDSFKAVVICSDRICDVSGESEELVSWLKDDIE